MMNYLFGPKLFYQLNSSVRLLFVRVLFNTISLIFFTVLFWFLYFFPIGHWTISTQSSLFSHTHILSYFINVWLLFITTPFLYYLYKIVWTVQFHFSFAEEKRKSLLLIVQFLFKMWLFQKILRQLTWK